MVLYLVVFRNDRCSLVGRYELLAEKYFFYVPSAT
jgi:hypothetical protein